MRFVRLALLATALSAGAAPAQVLGTNGGAASTATGTGTGSVGTSSTGSGSTGSSTSSTGSGSMGSGATTAAAPQISGGNIQSLSSTATATSAGVDKSNFLGASYSNPYYQGLFSNADGTPGGFGVTLYNVTGSGTTGTRTTSTTGNRTTTTAGRSTTGGANPFGTSGSPFGTTGGSAGRTGGTAASSQFGGQVIPLQRNISYSASLQFRAPVIAPAQQVADVQAVLARSSMMTNPANVTVVQDGAVFVLRGAVATADEARLAEGMVRLTPGVRDVRNELTFPKQ